MQKVAAALAAMLVLAGAAGCTANGTPTTEGSPAAEGSSATASSSAATRQASSDTNPTGVVSNGNYVHYVGVRDIVKDVSSLDGALKKYYVKYLDYVAPNGKPIRLVAADKVTDEQLLKAYNVLSFYLTNYQSYDKTAIANAMADKGAVLVLPNGADGDGNTPDEAISSGQPLYQMELPTAGSKWYQENDYKHRDASYEEIFHMVHDYGIGTTQNQGADPDLAKQIKAGLDSVLPTDKKDWGTKGIWGLGSKEWMQELAKEGSLEQEYIVSGIDSYYGLWEAYTESDKGMWGMYVPKNRAAVQQQDPKAYEIITSFMPANFTYLERIDPAFTGTFKMYLDTAEPYTYKSQYLQNVRLTGDGNSGVIGNDLDNIFVGNKGNNSIDGGNGNDVVQFAGASTDYTITKTAEGVTVSDGKNRDGQDTLVNIEILRFTDKDVAVSDIK